ncbi:stalk domain-containing protein [Paenibacillus solisilvae]|uniref:Stalk domain-containing protein n=1 Tax=Paenibacillus solisilvae TaxID=2486751 RepID=A0ABW0W244_9BACL
MMKRLVVMFTALCMFIALLPAVAGASAAPLEIKLSIGSPALTVNGVISTIEKPFQVKGTTFIPLSVITKAFGAGLKLEKNKIITLTYNQTSVILTIGSKVVKVNGAASTLAAEAKVVNNTTMVPLRVIATSFGATISVAGKQIIIKGVKAGAAGGGDDTNTGGINPDAGKSKVGDSYYGWSMNYPTDVSLSYQSDNGNATVWSDGSGDPSIVVTVDDVDQPYTREELREYVQDYFNETEFIVEKKSITVGDSTFEKVVSRDRKGWFFEYRAIQQGNRIYIVMAGAKSETRDGLNKYQSLLDSFKITFAFNDPTLKDVTKVKDGFMTVVDKEYGLTVKLPVDWVRDTESDRPKYESEDGFMDFRISSVNNTETDVQWMQRNRASIESDFQPDYLRNVTESTNSLADGPAQVLTYEFSLDKKTWYSEHDVYLVSGKHRYTAQFMYSMEDPSKGESLFNQIMHSLDINTAYVDANFSDIEETQDLDATITKTSKKYGYSITLPESWSGIKKDFEKDAVVYGVPYGAFSINVIDINGTASQFAEAIKQNASEDVDMIAAGAVVQTAFVTVNGKTLYKVVTELPKTEIPHTIVQYVFDKNGSVYILSFSVITANYTEKSRNLYDQIAASFTLN